MKDTIIIHDSEIHVPTLGFLGHPVTGPIMKNGEDIRRYLKPREVLLSIIKEKNKDGYCYAYNPATLQHVFIKDIHPSNL